MAIKVILVDDHRILRDGLRTLLDKEAGMEVVGEAENGRKAVRLAGDLKPDVVILDITMSDLNGIDAARKIIAESSRIKVIALSMHSDRRFVKGMLQAGASAYLLKDCAFDELTHAIRMVSSGKIYLSNSIADIVIKDYTISLQNKLASVTSTLTAREREVLQLLAEGRTTKQIASQLYVSVKTIETHRREIMNKLNIHSVAALTKYAVREGLTSLED